MTDQLFVNPNNLHVKIIERRIAPLDENASIVYSSVLTEAEPKLHTVWIASTMTVEEIDAQLAPVATSEEAAYLSEFDADRIAFRQQYNSTRDQLQAIEDKATFTNAEIISAVKFLSKTLRQVLRLLVKTRFSS